MLPASNCARAFVTITGHTQASHDRSSRTSSTTDERSSLPSIRTSKLSLQQQCLSKKGSAFAWWANLSDCTDSLNLQAILNYQKDSPTGGQSNAHPRILTSNVLASSFTLDFRSAYWLEREHERSTNNLTGNSAAHHNQHRPPCR